MKNKVLKKSLAAALALTLVSGAMPTVIGRNGLTKPAIVADAAEVGDIINMGDDIGNYPGYYASADGRTVHIWGLELELKVYGYYDNNQKIGVAYPQTSYESENTDVLVDVPAGRELEVPTGVKIIGGTGDENDPYQLELVYGDPMGDFQEVAVGTKWYVGDIINTNAYFTVPLAASNTLYSHYFTYSMTGQFLRKNLSAPELFSKDNNYSLFKNVLSGISGNWTQIETDESTIVYGGENSCATDICFAGNPIGIEVTGGSGTETDPFTIAPIYTDKLSNGTYKQTATKDGKNYTRFVFVKPKSELEGKSKAVFSAKLGNTTKTFETSTYYTGMTSNGEYFTPVSEDSVMFVVTVSSTSSLDGLKCELKLV